MYDFLLAAARLKAVRRQGWISRLSMEDPESVADHTFMTAVIGMLAADRLGLDAERVMRMALLHDLAESRTGDITPDQMSRERKADMEEEAFEEIVMALPGAMRNEYRAVWREYQERGSREAEIVHQVDKLEMALQARIYQDGGSPAGSLAPMYESAENEIADEWLRGLLDDIREAGNVQR